MGLQQVAYTHEMDELSSIKATSVPLGVCQLAWTITEQNQPAARVQVDTLLLVHTDLLLVSKWGLWCFLTKNTFFSVLIEESPDTEDCLGTKGLSAYV